MNVTLWAIAGLLAAVFLASGAMKLVQSKERLVASSMPALAAFSGGGIKAIGALEVLAAAGLILPAVSDIAPVLVPLAAVGSALLMVGASIVHLRRHEAKGIATTVVLLALAVLVAWGRFGPYSFTV
jgi:uncharacterized membrane protein YhfC